MILNSKKRGLAIFDSLEVLDNNKVKNNMVFTTGLVVSDVISTTQKKPLFFEKFFSRIKRFKVDKYFDNIKSSLTKITNDIDYETQRFIVLQAKKQAEITKQVSLLERLSEIETRIDKELQFIKYGFSTFISEEDIVKFSQNAPSYLKLDYIKNYCRILPDEVQKEFNKAISIDLFDNYVVLHFDPEDNGSLYTKKEREDPILFGVIKNSRRLYYITDWVDEYCDLTLDSLISTLSLTDNDTYLFTNNNIIK
jgi:hypothetical protein